MERLRFIKDQTNVKCLITSFRDHWGNYSLMSQDNFGETVWVDRDSGELVSMVVGKDYNSAEELYQFLEDNPRKYFLLIIGGVPRLLIRSDAWFEFEPSPMSSLHNIIHRQYLSLDPLGGLILNLHKKEGRFLHWSISPLGKGSRSYWEETSPILTANNFYEAVEIFEEEFLNPSWEIPPVIDPWNYYKNEAEENT